MLTLIEQAEAKRLDAKNLIAKADALKSLDGLTDAQSKQIDAFEEQALVLHEDAEKLEAKSDREAKLKSFQEKSKQPRARKIPAADGADRDRITVLDQHEDDPKRGFRSDREFMNSVIAASRGGSVDERLKPLATVGSDEHSTFDDPHGGFGVPEAFSPNVREIAAEADPIGGLVTRIPMTAPVVSFPARVDKDHSTSVTGGLVVTRRAESAAGASSRMELERVKLETSMLFGLAYITEELLTDSPISFAAMLSAGMRTEFGAKLLDERLNGLGAGEFLGVNNSPCLITVPKEAAQVADTLVGQNIIKMRSRCWGYGTAVWLANHDCLPQLMTLHIAGTNGDIFLFHPGNGTDVPATLLGRPIYFTEFAETIGDAGDLLLGNWAEYLEGDFGAPGEAESIHVRFVNHERAFKFWLRNAGSPWWRMDLTPKRGANTLSPFVRLAART